MIKTLRITGVAVVLLAAAVLALVLVPTSVFHLGTRGNRQFSRILSEPNAVERWRSQHGSDPQGSQDTTPPLVRQAETLAKIINPPEKPAVRQADTRPVSTAVKPPSPLTPSAKFGVVGTAYSPTRPTASFAYIRMADNTYQWVQQGEQVSHYTIKEIRGDSITCWDGSRNVVMPVEAIPETASILTGGIAPAASAGPGAGMQPSHPVVRPIVPNPQVAATQPVTPVTGAADAPVPQLTPQEEEVLGSLVDRIKQAGGDPAAQNAAIKKVIEEYRSSRITAGETEKLGDLGEELNDRRDAAKEAQRRELLRRLSAPRTTK